MKRYKTHIPKLKQRRIYTKHFILKQGIPFLMMFNTELVKDQSYLAVECTLSSCDSVLLGLAPILSNCVGFPWFMVGLARSQ